MKHFLGKILLLLPIFALIACGSSAEDNSTSSQLATNAPIAETPAVEVPIEDAPIEEQPNVSFACAYSGTPLEIDNIGTIRIETENYDTCETSFSTGISVESFNESENFVHFSQANQYVEYTLNIATSGLYSLNYRLQNGASNMAQLNLFVNNSIVENSTYTLAASDTQWLESINQDIYLSDGPQVVRLSISEGMVNVDYVELTYNEPLQVTPELSVSHMRIGINLGNTLDAPHEGDWAPVAQLKYFVAFKNAGFKHVRIPATWDNYTNTEFPYNINIERMDRTEQIVDWALAQGYEVILNMHHESWLKNDYTNTNNQERFEAIWRQISVRFKNKSARLLFEILNEPNGMSIADANNANARILPIIREMHPNRNIVFSGHGFTPLDSLLATDIPNDDHLIGNFHSYDPWPFAGQCIISWGNAQDFANLENLYIQAKAWSVEHNIPVTVNEFGAAHYDFTSPENICSETERLAYLKAHVTFATAHGIAATVWDDNGSFGIYDRLKGTWGAEKDVLVSKNNE